MMQAEDVRLIFFVLLLNIHCVTVYVLITSIDVQTVSAVVCSMYLSYGRLLRVFLLSLVLKLFSQSQLQIKSFCDLVGFRMVD